MMQTPPPATDRARPLTGWLPQRLALGAAILLLALSASAPPARAQSTWTTRTAPTSATPRGLAFDGTTFVGVTDSLNQVLDSQIITSADGITWTRSNSGTTLNLRSIAAAPSLWIAAGENGAILTSPDALTWTLQTTPAAVDFKILSGVAYGNGTYIAVGGTGTIIHSSDAVTWSVATAPPAQFLQNATYGGGKFVAVGAAGTILYSADGSSWSAANSGTSNYLSGIVYASGQFVAVGQGGTVVTSADGISWTSQTSNAGGWLRSITFGDGRFVAGGDSGIISTSPDGTTWESQDSGVVEALFAIAYGSDKFAAVGGKVDIADPGATARITTSPTALDLGFRWSATALSTDETAASVSLDVLRIGPDDVAIQANWTVSGGSATDGEDFTDSSGSIDFAVGESLRTITIPLSDDAAVEGAETIELTLAGVTSGWRVHGSALAVITLIDDEDRDSDALPDAWEITYFGSISVADGSSDPDGDHNNNAREFAQGTDPTLASSAKYTLTTLIAAGSGTVTASPQRALYDASEPVTITAVGTSGFGFDHWGRDASGTSNPLQITMNIDTTISATFLVTLAEALDFDGVQWFTGSTGFPWYGQTTITSDGIDAISAEGDGLSSGNSIVLETLVWGPAELSFVWKVSSAEFADFLRFYDNGNPEVEISGEVGWETQTFHLPPGPHFLSWNYEGDFFFPEGNNAAWLDQVSIAYPFSSWLADHFSVAELADPLISGPGADPDCDLMDNFSEFAFGSLPRSGSVSPNSPRLSLLETTPGEWHAAVEFKRPVLRSGEVIYTVETSATLLPGSWVPLAGTAEIVAETNGIQTIRLIDPAVRSNGQNYRVIVTERL